MNFVRKEGMKFRFPKITITRRSAEDSQPESPTHFNSMSNLRGLFTSRVQTEEAMKFTAVFAAMRLRAESIASLPKLLTHQTKNGREPAVGHPVYKLLKYRPNSWMNIFSFWEYLNACLDGWGNAYAIITRGGDGSPVELIPIHPKLVDITFLNRKKWYRVAGSKYFDGTYPDEDMLHFFSLSLDGIKGVNPIVYNSAAIRSGLSSTAFGNEFFDKGGNMKGYYETDKMLSTTTYKEIMTHLSEFSDHDIPILENGLKYKSVGIAPEAAQMLQTRTFALQDIARIFNVPPHMIADLSRSTFSNIEHQDIQFAKYSLRSTVKRYETELDCKLLFDDEVGVVESKFNLDGLLRGDMKTRAEYYSKAVQSGWLSRNEVREMENRNKAPELDVFLYPQNLSPAGSQQPIKKKNNAKD